MLNCTFWQKNQKVPIKQYLLTPLMDKLYQKDETDLSLIIRLSKQETVV